jgi:hypothetical protein
MVGPSDAEEVSEHHDYPQISLLKESADDGQIEHRRRANPPAMGRKD